MPQARAEATDTHGGGHFPASTGGGLPAGALHGAAAPGGPQAVPQHAAQHLRGTVP